MCVFSNTGLSQHTAFSVDQSLSAVRQTERFVISHLFLTYLLSRRLCCACGARAVCTLRTGNCSNKGGEIAGLCAH